VNKTDAIEKIIDGYAAIDRTLMLSGIGRSDERHIAAARAELAALRAEAKAHDAYVQMAHRNTILASVLYNEAHGITDGSWPDLGVLIHWFMDERTAQARQIAALREALRKAWCLLDVAEHNDPVTEEAFRILSSYGTNDL